MANFFRTDGWVKSAQGPAVAGAQIYVCSQPANVASLPPSPLVNLYSDPNGLVPITQPIITDGFGHYYFYAQPSVVTLVVGLGGIVQQVYPDQSIGGASSGGTALTLETDGAANANQLVLNLKSGTGISLVSDANGGVTVNATGGFGIAGKGFFLGPGVMTLPLGFSNPTDTQPFNGTSTTIYVWQFTLSTSWTLRKCTYVWFNAFAGTPNIGFAIYDSSGNKLIDSGSFSVAIGTSNTPTTNTFSAVTLTPGVYYFAQSSVISSTGLSSPGFPFTYGAPDGTQFITALNSVISTYFGSAANTRPTGGPFPSTLGTITAINNVSPGVAPAACIWTP